MNLPKILLKFGTIPAKVNYDTKHAKTNVFNFKFVCLTILELTLSVVVFLPWFNFFHGKSVVVLEAIKITFYFLVIHGALLFQVVEALAVQKIGLLAVDLKYKVLLIYIESMVSKISFTTSSRIFLTITKTFNLFMIDLVKRYPLNKLLECNFSSCQG